jgi:hypothetical protein
MFIKPKPTILSSISILESEELIDGAYECLLSLMQYVSFDKKGYRSVDIWGGHVCSKKDMTKRHMDILSVLIDGIYYPGSKRDYLCGIVDIKNDILVNSGSVILISNDNEILMEFISIKKIKMFDKKDVIMTIDQNDIECCYIVDMVHIYKNIKREPFVFRSFMSVLKNGEVVPIVSRRGLRDTAGAHGAFLLFNEKDSFLYGCGAISLLSDRQYIWLVETKEHIFGNVFAKIQFGIENEMIKSLFYARSLPLTESGRKRPILHWVRAHQRRLESGIDIDIDKYLRGINEFNMGNLNFNITQPNKLKIAS